jgi:hypothetical protein
MEQRLAAPSMINILEAAMPPTLVHRAENNKMPIGDDFHL